MGAVSHQSVVASTTEAAGSGAAGLGDRIEDICRQRQDGGYDMAYFAFRQYRGDEEFIFELTDEDKIAHARRIISGEETERVHVLGKIRKQKKPYNPMWDYHLDPDTISFFKWLSRYAMPTCGTLKIIWTKHAVHFFPAVFGAHGTRESHARSRSTRWRHEYGTRSARRANLAMSCWPMACDPGDRSSAHSARYGPGFDGDPEARSGRTVSLPTS